MKRVKRLVSAVTTSVSLVRGIIRALRKGARQNEGAETPWTPPEATTAPEPVEPPAEPAPVEEPPAPAAPVEEAPTPSEEPVETASEEPVETASEETVEAPEPELVVKGVVIYHPERLVSWVNEATEDALKDAGVKGRALSLLQEERPFADADALGHTAGIGRRTLQALCTAAEA